MKKIEPLYHKVESYIKNIIIENDLKPGDIIPTEAELEKTLNVSRTTIRQAIANLQYQGYVIKYQGKGTFVADKTYEEQLPLLKGFTEDAIARGIRVKSLLLGKNLILPYEELAQTLKISDKEEVLKISRVRYIEDEPIQISTSYLPSKEIESMDWKNIDFSTNSLYKSLEMSGVIISSGEERISVDVANELDVALLHVSEGFPIFVSKRLVFDDKGNIIEYADSRTRGDRHVAVIKLKR